MQLYFISFLSLVFAMTAYPVKSQAVQTIKPFVVERGVNSLKYHLPLNEVLDRQAWKLLDDGASHEILLETSPPAIQRRLNRLSRSLRRQANRSTR